MKNQIKKKFVKATKYYNQHTILQFIKRILDGLLFQCFQRTLVFVHLDLKNIQSKLEESHNFSIATVDDIQYQQDYDDGWYDKKTAIERIENGHRLFVFKEKERMIYFVWIENKVTIKWFNLHFDLPSDLVYHTGEYTLPQYRGKGIPSKIKIDVYNYLKKDGIKHVICVIDPLNTISLKINKRIGFKEYQIAVYRRFWLFKYYRVQKYNSSHYKTFICVFKSPEDLWQVFLPINHKD